jgi:hypothetical protein
MQLLSAVAIIVAGSGLALLLNGCSSDYSPPDPTTRPLADPMGYQPDFDDDMNISGGGTSNFDSKAFKRDVDHVFNP